MRHIKSFISAVIFLSIFHYRIIITYLLYNALLVSYILHFKKYTFLVNYYNLIKKTHVQIVNYCIEFIERRIKSFKYVNFISFLNKYKLFKNLFKYVLLLRKYKFKFWRFKYSSNNYIQIDIFKDILCTRIYLH